MSIEWFRDLILIIWGIAGIAITLTIGFLAVMLYRRIRPALDSIKTTTKTVEKITSAVSDEVAGPLSKVAALVQGIRQASSLINQIRNRREDN
jgi:uncharacterized protein YoxC